MVKKVFLILVILIVLSFINVSFVNVSEAADSFSSTVQEANDWIEKGKNQFNDPDKTKIDVTDITEVILPISQALTTIGVGIILCVAAYMGIKWITANPEEQAKLKQQSIGLVVAAVVVLGAYTIWSIALKIVSNF